MFARPNRLRNPIDIKRIYRRGSNQQASHFSLTSLPNYQNQSRATVVVSTKISKKAVRRNRIRRQLRATLAELWPQLKSGYDIILTVKRDTSTQNHQQLKEQLTDCLNKAQLLSN